MQGLDRPLVFVFTITSELGRAVSRRSPSKEPSVRCRVVFPACPAVIPEVTISMIDPAGESRWEPIGEGIAQQIGGMSLTENAICSLLVRALGPFLNRPFFDDPDESAESHRVPAFTATPNRGRVFDLGEI
jgi:hypothetical protein